MNKTSSPDYCRSIIRTENYNLYLLCFFIPRESREAALALMALHCELNLIARKANDPTMKIIRLKWWHDEVMKLFDKKNDDKPSPILELLEISLPPLHKQENTLKPLFETYFQSFQDFLNNQESDPTAILYDLLCAQIIKARQKERFINLLQYHDELAENVPFRALRLWFNRNRMTKKN